jgi:hypothetical protein
MTTLIARVSGSLSWSAAQCGRAPEAVERGTPLPPFKVPVSRSSSLGWSPHHHPPVEMVSPLRAVAQGGTFNRQSECHQTESKCMIIHQSL